jgi:putative ABC transport system ATP-binding protein
MLTLTRVCKTFNPGTINEKKAIVDIDLEIGEGEFVTVIGGNGAGKSTLLNLIAGVYEVDSGSIVLDGEDITGYKEHLRAKYLGRVFQDPMMGTASNMQIEENLAIARRRGDKRGLGWGISRAEKLVYSDLLKSLDLGLEHRMTTKVGLLSGGQRQALTLLMATLKKPRLLLLDEHTAALDPKTAQKVLALTEEIVARESLSAFMVTHNMRDAIRFGDRLITMHEGRIIYDVRGDEKKNLQVADLLRRFETVKDEGAVSDRMLLA